MPSSKKVIIFCFLIISFISCSSKNDNIEKNEVKVTNFKKIESRYFEYEDQYIIFALEYENERRYYDAIDVYTRLFENTNKYEYLVKSLAIASQLKEYAFVKEKASLYMLENIKEEEIILKLYTLSLFKLKEKDNAILNAKKLVSSYPTASNYELLGSIYIEDKQYLEAYKVFDKAFKLEGTNSALLNLTNIQFFGLSQKDEAIKKIEENIQKSEYDFNLSFQLLTFYENIKDKNKINNFLKEMYYFYKKDNNQLLINKTKALFVKYVVSENMPMAIEFWEQNGEKDEILLNLYKISNQNQKAIILLEELYNQTNNIDYLAQQAIIEFESAKDKKSVLNSVIAKFEKVLEKSDNHVYQNYLAYMLIDYDLDVKRGLILVNKALDKEPNNIAYLDTLAWGKYKMKSCLEAYLNMKQIVDQIGLDDEEIRLHWEKIKECK